MAETGFSSLLLAKAVEELASLPGIGRKSALRFALHLLRQPAENVERLGNSIIKLRKEIKYCSECNMLSDSQRCSICSDRNRDRSLICVVESIRDVMSIENTQKYRGLYHVLGGIISPIDGIGPSDLPIDSLLKRVSSGEPHEVILALSTSMEGETTSLFLFTYKVKVTSIARGVGFGDDLEYTDELTLGRSIEDRQLFKPDK